MVDNNSSNDNDEYNNIKGRTFFNKYHCLNKIGRGAFGCIYKAEYNNEYFALKFENKNNRNHIALENEAIALKYLEGTNIPRIKSYSSTSEYNILVMQLLGKSLEYYIDKLNFLSIKTVCILGHQILSILEYIHDKSIIHRDIKPDNLCMGLNYISQKVFLIDFGLAKKYRSSSTLCHYPLIIKKGLTGTPRYASINALKGYEQSRRDDLESLGYVMIYLLRGELPWQGTIAKSKEERNKKILEKKIKISSSELCDGFPLELEKYLDYVKNLEYTETPDYDMLRDLLMNIMKQNNLKYDYIFDWTTKEEIRIRDNVEYWLKEEFKNNSSKNVYYIANMKNKNRDNKYNNNSHKNESFNDTNFNRLTNTCQSNDLSPTSKDNEYQSNEEVNANCSSACIIF